MSYRGYCPRHEFEVRKCSHTCLEARIAFKQSALALRVYWCHRKTGMQPLDALSYRLRFGMKAA